jgi:FkbM family methyltransferase
LFEGFKLFYQLYIAEAEKIYLKNYGAIHLRKGKCDVGTFNQIFLEKEYDVDFSFEPKLIIDAGANIGLTTLFFSHKYSSATIISIEPETENFKYLQKNTFGFANVISLNKAIWINDGRIFLVKSNSYDSHSVTELEESPDSVESIMISTILEDYNIEIVDILKIDIEGAEREIFAGNFQAWLPKIRTLVIELHDRFKPGCSMSLFKALNGYNYSLSIRGELLIINFNSN